MRNRRYGPIITGAVGLLALALLGALVLRQPFCASLPSLDGAPWCQHPPERASAEPDADSWPRYADAGLGISWSCPPGWTAFALADEAPRLIVFMPPDTWDAPGMLLFLSASTDPADVLRWDPKAANTHVAGQLALLERFPGGQNPPMRRVSFRADDRLVSLALSYGDGVDSTVFERIVATVSPTAELGAHTTFETLADLSAAWDPCSPGCNIKSYDPSWCNLLVSGADWGGVPVYSNGTSVNNICTDTYGLKFQCVELVQRYYWEKVGHDTGTGSPRWGIASAYQAWNTHPASLVPCANGGGSTPQHGDILIWKGEGVYYPHGHVAVVSHIEGGRVYYVQQNVSSVGGWGSREWKDGRIQDTYIIGWLHHQRGDTTPPTGGLTSPPEGVLVRQNRVYIEGWASDAESGVKEVRLMAHYAGAWHQVGSPWSSTTYALDWDMAAAGVPDGRVQLAVDIQDNAGNWARSPGGLRTFVKLTRPTPYKAYLPVCAQAGKWELRCQELLRNGGYEGGDGWVFGSTPRPAAYTTKTVRSGGRALRAGIEPGTANVESYSSAYQAFRVPREAASATLRFWWWRRTEEAPLAQAQALSLEAAALPVLVDGWPALQVVAPDTQQALLLDADTRVIVARISVDRVNDGGWVQQTYDLMPYRDRNLLLYLNAYNDGAGGRTWMYVDDVSISYCLP